MYFTNKRDENVHRFEFSAIRGELLERKKREIERDSFGILYTGYLLSIVMTKRERERATNNK